MPISVFDSMYYGRMEIWEGEKGSEGVGYEKGRGCRNKREATEELDRKFTGHALLYQEVADARWVSGWPGLGRKKKPAWERP
jgi:hypothetical protein